MPKPKGQLDKLSDQDHEKLAGWLLGGMTYAKAVNVLKLELGIETNSRQLSEFWDEYCSPRFLERRRGAAQLSTAIRKEAQANPEDFDSATVDVLSRISFEMANAASMSGDLSKRQVKDVKTLFALILKKRDQDSKDKSLELDKEKFKAGLRTKLETGMEALFAEIKDNPKALEAFNAMKGALANK